MVHEDGVYHGTLVHDKDIGLEKVVLAPLKSPLPETVFQHPVDGSCRISCCLLHALGCATRRRRLKHPGPHPPVYLDKGVYDRCLSGPGSARDDHHLFREGPFYSGHLFCGQIQVDPFLDPGQSLVHLYCAKAPWGLDETFEVLFYALLRNIETGQIDGLAIGLELRQVRVEVLDHDLAF